MGQKSRADIRRGVHSRIRKKVRGTADRPRLAVFRSTNHIYAQVIDDDNGKTMAAASTVEKSLKVKSGANVEGAREIGKAIAERSLGAGITKVVYDRGGYIYHGRVKALLDATRKAGLNKNAAMPKDEKEKKKETGDKKSVAKPKKGKAEKVEKAEKPKAAEKNTATKKQDSPKADSKPSGKDEKQSKEKPESKKESTAKNVEKEENDNE